MGGQATEQGPGGRAVEPAPCQRDPRPQPGQPEPGQGERVAREVEDRPEQLRGEALGVPDQRTEQPPPRASVVGAPIDIQPGGGGRERALEHHRAIGRQGMGERSIGMHDVDTERRQVERAEERRGRGQGHDRRAHVVAEAGERQLHGPGPAPDGRRRLVHGDAPTGPGQGQRRGQAVRAGPDDDRVEGRRARHGPATTNGSPAR
jgi:hypothetical protein